jgi:hypothetical protein
VNPLGLSSEQVRQYKKLFSDAINWYIRDQVGKNKKIEHYIVDAEYSLLPKLKQIVDSGEELRSDEGLPTFLGEEVLTGYLAHLRTLKSQPWVKHETLKKQVVEMRNLSRDNDLKIDGTSDDF